MLTCWLIITALLSGSASPAGATVAVSAIFQVEAQCKAELTLPCGDGNTPGLVHYWHTPFGDLQPGLHTDLGPAYMQHKGNLVLSNISRVHSGLYYCLLQHTGGITLSVHQLRVKQESSSCDEHSSRGARRPRRDVGSAAERQVGLSDGHFTGAVVGSVLLTFVVGFSAGALCRSQVLRCLDAFIARLRSPRAPQNDMPNHASEVSMTTTSPMLDSHVVEIEQATSSSTTSSSASVPPAKPQRSFREKRLDDWEMMDNLKGCKGQTVGEEEGEKTIGVTDQDFKEDREKEEEEKTERSSEKMSVQERNGDTEKVKDKEEDGEGGRCLAEKNPASKEEREDDGERGLFERKQWCDEEREEQEEGGDLEETEFAPGEECEETKTNEEINEPVKKEGKEKNNTFIEEKGENHEQENRSREGEAWRRSCEKDKGTVGIREEEERWRKESKDDGETDSEEEESLATEQPACSLQVRPGRPSRVIRLYEYDEQGQPYSHAPEPRPGQPGPAPRPQLRSISLSRLNAIMAAASAGPLDPKDPKDSKDPERTQTST